MAATICLLADRPGLIGQIAAGYAAWSPAWYGPDGPGDAMADLEARAQRGRIPLGLAAVDGDQAVGAVALAGESMSRGADFGAWLVGLWVAPAHRGQGVGLGLIRAAVGQAAALGIADLRAGTASAAGLFERAGWSRLEPILHEGKPTQVYAIRPREAG